MQGMRLSVCRLSFLALCYLSHTAGLYTTWAASFHRFIYHLSHFSSPSFTSSVASTGYEAPFPLSPLLVSSRTKLSLEYKLSHTLLEKLYLSLSPRIARSYISHLFFIAAERGSDRKAPLYVSESPYRRCARSRDTAVCTRVTIHRCVNPSLLCEFAFEPKGSLFS
jgi:hypothetical protein